MKTPLTFGEGSDREWYIHDADENWIAEAVPNGPGEAEKTARRIVACVNACKRFSTELMEAAAACGGITEDPAESQIKAEKQRDELLRVLIGVVIRCEGSGYIGQDGQYLKTVREAIEKVGAGETAIDGHNVELTGAGTASALNAKLGAAGPGED